ncbi:MAG: histidinol-phosphate transaminase [Geodermatophilaceae bacterium]|nr:histidinol-phosphate transaminase [Geodermatophilaceae bacterium]
MIGRAAVVPNAPEQQCARTAVRPEQQGGGPVSLKPRADIASLPAYKPGRNPADLARELGLASAVKLASNEVAFGPLPSVIDAVTAAAGSMNRYPDNGAQLLTEALAAKTGKDAGQIAVGCGSVSLCQQLLQAYAGPGDEVIFAWRSFEAYPLLVTVSGAVPVMVPLRDRYHHDLDAMAAAITDRTKVVFVCNPNNPTSTAVRRDPLLRFLDSVPDTVVVALDEAYREFVADPDIPDGIELADGRPNVCVLRTFSKAYGLAGLRVGYLVAGDPAVAEAVRKTYVPFSVSSVAQAAAVASLAAEDEMLARCTAVVVERERVIAKLRDAGAELPDSHANFIWLPLGDAATDFAAACEQRGIIVRPFAGDGVRVTIGAPAENDAFLAIAAERVSR